MSRLSPFTPDQQLAPLFAEETAKPVQNQIFHLITLVLPSPEEPLRLVDSNYSVDYQGFTYQRFPIKFTGAAVNSDGTIDKATVIVSNVDRMLTFYVEQYAGLRNMRITVKTVYANALDYLYTPNPDGTATQSENPDADPYAYLEDEYLVDNYSANEQIVTFQLDPIVDMEIRIPRRRFMVDSCFWQFKDPTTCKYSGTVTHCVKNFEGCKQLNNESNFGGFPGISGTRRIIL